MSGNYRTPEASPTSEVFKTSEVCLEHIAAELTEAAYPVMLRHGVVDNWLDVELELWKTMRETVKKWDQERPRANVMLEACR